MREDVANLAAAEWRCGNGPRVVLHGEVELGAGAALGVAWKRVEDAMARG